LSFTDHQVDMAMDVFGLAAAVARHRRIWFSEAPARADGPLPLGGRGLILRVRTGEKPDSTLKLRGPEGCLDPVAWRQLPTTGRDGAKLEGDWSGEHRMIAASLSHDLDPPTPDPRSPGDVRALLSDRQIHLAHAWVIPLDKAEPLGPVLADSWEGDIDGVAEKCAFERWTVAELRFLEISLRVDDDEAETTQQRLAQAVHDAGLTVAPKAGTKTDTVLRRLIAVRWGPN
jgi:hypothetical protein